MLPTEQMVRGGGQSGFQNMQQQQMMMHGGPGRQPFGVSPKDFDQYYGDEYGEDMDDDYDDEGAPQRQGGR